MGDFPNNSQRAKQPKSDAEVSPEVDLQIERIITGEAKVSKPSGFQRFRRSFIAGDASSVSDHVFWNLMIPSAKDALSDACSTFIDMMIYGEKRSRTIPGAPATGPGSNSRMNYGAISTGQRVVLGPNQGQNVEQGSNRFDLNNITVGTRAEAEAVISKMFEVLDKYHVVTVANLNSMLGVSSDYVDSKWGWTNLADADVKRVRTGVKVVLPPPIDLGA